MQPNEVTDAAVKHTRDVLLTSSFVGPLMQSVIATSVTAAGAVVLTHVDKELLRDMRRQYERELGRLDMFAFVRCLRIDAPKMLLLSKRIAMIDRLLGETEPK